LRISGITPDVDPARRLSDVLNGPQAQITVSQATIYGLDGRVLDTSERIVIEKRNILVVVPRESQGQLAAQRARRFGILPPSASPLPALVLLPPYLADGSISFRDPKDAGRGVASLSAFFPVLDASLTLNGNQLGRASVMLLNRDAVLGLSLRPGPEQPRHVPLADDSLGRAAGQTMPRPPPS
jgi:hypothetical protein